VLTRPVITRHFDQAFLSPPNRAPQAHDTSSPVRFDLALVALQDDPDYQGGLRIDAASNAMAGRLEQTHKSLARLRQLNPELRVSNLKDVLGPYQLNSGFDAGRTSRDVSNVQEAD
jgi:hypothetical protein